MTLVAWLALAFASTVELDGWRWSALREPKVADEPLPPPVVTARDVRIRPANDEVRFDGTWSIDVPEPGWFEVRLAGPEVLIAEASWQGRPVPLLDTPDGPHVAIELTGPGVLRLRGVKAGDPTRGPVMLDLLPAAVGRVRVDTAMEPVLTAHGPVVRLGGESWCGSSGLALALQDPAPPSPRPDLAVATAALGLTVGEGTYDARARVRWEVRSGVLGAVAVDVPGAGSDLAVSGATVASWTRSGDTVSVTLREPEDRLVELELSWSAPVPGGDEAKLAVPALSPRGAFRTESTVQLARDGEVEVVPELSAWAPIPFADLPEWGRGLVVGAATATFAATGAPGGQLSLLRFTPVSGPPTFVDVATITAALTDHGTVLMRAHYAVRNDRSPHLRFTAPPGSLVIGARVAGDTARVAKTGDTWLIPLGKSVETVEGLLSFPVEVTLLLRGDAWERREERGLPLPVVDAPVAVTRATLYLPAGYENLAEPGTGDVVADWTEGEGITYGEATGAAAEAEVLMQEAVQAWMSNEFDAAQGLLDQLEDVGGFDENARRLQSNLDVITGKAEGQYDATLERRVKEQAKARSLDEAREQEEALKQAESSYLSGDYKAAEENYGKALELGKKLDLLEQSESVEVETRNMMLETRLEASSSAARQVEEKAQLVRITAQNIVISDDRAAYGPMPSTPPESMSAPSPTPTPVAAASPVVILPDEGITVEAKRDAMNAPDTSTSEVLTKDFLSRLPTGRSYQSAVGLSATGAGEGRNGTFRGDSSNDNTYMLDGANLTEVTDEAVLDTEEDIERIPVGRTFSAVLETVPGVVVDAKGKRKEEGGKNGAHRWSGAPVADPVAGEVGGLAGGVMGGVLGGEVSRVEVGQHTVSVDAEGWDDDGVAVTGSSTTTFDFDGEDITGELLTPDGANVAGGALGDVIGTGTGTGGLGLRGTGMGGGGAADEGRWRPGGTVGYGSEVTIDLDEAEPMPASESEDAAIAFEVPVVAEDTSAVMPVEMVVVRRGGGVNLPKVSIAANKRADDIQAPPPPPPAEPASPTQGIQFGRDKPMPQKPGDAAPVDRGTRSTVSAVQLTAIIPNQGDPVRYEHLLLEAGAVHTLPIEAKLPRRNR